MREQNQTLSRSMRAAMILWCVTAGAFADVLTLKNGETVRCTFLGGTSRLVRVEENGVVKTYDVGQIATLSFLDGDTSPAAAVAPHPPAPAGITSVLPAGTSVTVRLIDSVDSGTARPGQTFAGATDEPVLVNGAEVIPRDSPVQMRIVSESMSVGQATLTVALSTVTIHGKAVPISSSDVKSSASSPGSSQGAARIGSGTSALAGVAGMLGAGRAVSTAGSAAGTAINTGNQLIVHGAKVKIPAGTRLSFRTQSQVVF